MLVGAAVDVRYTLAAGASALLMIFIALAFKAVGVIICLLGDKADREGTAFLYNRLSSESNCTGCYRFRCPSDFHAVKLYYQ